MRARTRMLLLALVVLLLGAAALLPLATRMPGDGRLVTRTPADLEVRAARLEASIQHLCLAIGERHLWAAGSLDAAADWICAELQALALATTELEYALPGHVVRSRVVVAEIKGASDELVILGAHYDTVRGTVGANDNASGVAVLLELARTFAGSTPQCTLRFAAFPNEEPPHFNSSAMGSRVYAQHCRARGERVHAMISLESLGCFHDAAGSQRYPAPLGALYPDRGDFVAFVGRVADVFLIRRAAAAFRSAEVLPSEGGALPSWLPGVGWSDHSAFWQEGYRAFMVTDTALFRDDAYHTPQDTPERLDYPRMARVCVGMEDVVRALAFAP